MTIQKDLEKYLASGVSLLYLISDEEQRVERLVIQASQKVFGDQVSICSWSCIEGLVRHAARERRILDDTKDPVLGLRAFLKHKELSTLIFRDLHLFMDGRPDLIRQLRECAKYLKSRQGAIFFICPRLGLPEELFSLFKIVDVPLPGSAELSQIFDRSLASQKHAESLRASLKEDLKEKIVTASMGFTGDEAQEAFTLALMDQTEITAGAVDLVLDEKAALVRKSGVLEFVSTQLHPSVIGGLFNLKKWLTERARAFSPEAAKHGLTIPKGVLLMGVSGCGKSLAVKAIAAYWKLPLLRLDMGRLYDGLAGPPEEAMRKAIKTSEATAPCVLWIDEIEAGIANQLQKQAGGHEARVLAQFLTWMQEKTSPVFVGATANEVEVLPPELLRKGRFDELFYVGLPSTEERKEILSIHMKRKNLDPDRFDMEYLAESTAALNGAEIEQGVIAAIYESLSVKKEVSEHILSNSLRVIVPLSRTMRERIQKIEAWARDRAQKASLDEFDQSN